VENGLIMMDAEAVTVMMDETAARRIAASERKMN